MATNTGPTSAESDSTEAFKSFDCPQCQATVTRRHGSLRCPECGFTPRHGAD